MLSIRMVTRYAAVAALGFLVCSCGKFDRIDDGGFTKVTFKRHSPGQPLINSVLSQGILIYAYSSSYATNLKITDELSAAGITLPNGSYKFFAFGYGYPIDNFGTDLRCAVASADLTGSAQTVSLTFMQSNCADAAFAPNSSYLDTTSSTVPNSGPFFAQFDFIHCSSAAGTNLATVAATNDCSTMPATGINAPWGSVAKFQVVVPIFANANGSYARLGEAYRTPCTNSWPSASGGTSFSQYVRFPVGNTAYPGAFPLEIETFSESSCTSPPIGKHSFQKGLIFGAYPDASYMGTALPSASRVRVFLRQ